MMAFNDRSDAMGDELDEFGFTANGSTRVAQVPSGEGWAEPPPARWFARSDGKHHGPLDEAGVIALLRGGRLGPDDRAYLEGGDGWRALRSIDVFRDHIPSVPTKSGGRREAKPARASRPAARASAPARVVTPASRPPQEVAARSSRSSSASASDEDDADEGDFRSRIELFGLSALVADDKKEAPDDDAERTVMTPSIQERLVVGFSAAPMHRAGTAVRARAEIMPTRRQQSRAVLYGAVAVGALVFIGLVVLAALL